MITSKSLFHANIAFVFKPEGFISPDTSVFGGLYSGKDVAGARFTDDPVARTKVLVLPELHLRVIIEGSLLRIEDLAAKDPNSDSILIKQAYHIYKTLFPSTQAKEFGFNLDVVFKSNQVIPIQPPFLHFFDPKILETNDLLDFGFQFTLENGSDKYRDLWFCKITSPLEIAAHVNRHFIAAPEGENHLQKQFQTCYTDIDKVVENIKL